MNSARVSLALLLIGAALLPAAASAQSGRDGTRWGAAVIAADGGQLEGCRLRAGDGSQWRVSVRANNRAGGGALVARAEVLSRGTAADAWTRLVPRGEVSGAGELEAAARGRQRLRLHVRRPDGSGTLTWVVRPVQLPSCAGRRGWHWTDLLSHDGSHLEACGALVGGAYGPVWRVWGRGRNDADQRYFYGMSVRRGGHAGPLIGQWNTSAASGEVTPVRMVHVSLLQPDLLIAGMGNGEGGLGGDQAADRLAVC